MVEGVECQRRERSRKRREWSPRKLWRGWKGSERRRARRRARQRRRGWKRSGWWKGWECQRRERSRKRRERSPRKLCGGGRGRSDGELGGGLGSDGELGGGLGSGGELGGGLGSDGGGGSGRDGGRGGNASGGNGPGSGGSGRPGSFGGGGRGRSGGSGRPGGRWREWSARGVGVGWWCWGRELDRSSVAPRERDSSLALGRLGRQAGRGSSTPAAAEVDNRYPVL